MARRAARMQKLEFAQIVIGADVDTIKAALEARLKIDELLLEREEAYKRIAEIEAQVEETIGETGVFEFPPPAMPVAEFPKRRPPVAKKAPAVTEAQSTAKPENKTQAEKA